MSSIIMSITNYPEVTKIVLISIVCYIGAAAKNIELPLMMNSALCANFF